jgi:hypothetical protein
MRLEEKWNSVEESQRTRKALIVYFVILAVIVALSMAAAHAIEVVAPYFSKFLSNFGAQSLAAVVTFLTCHLVLELIVREKYRLSRLWPFVQVRRFRKFLWTFVVLGFALGVLGNLYANFIQKNIDANAAKPAASPTASPFPSPRDKQ